MFASLPARCERAEIEQLRNYSKKSLNAFNVQDLLHYYRHKLLVHYIEIQ